MTTNPSLWKFVKSSTQQSGRHLPLKRASEGLRMTTAGVDGSTKCWGRPGDAMVIPTLSDSVNLCLYHARPLLVLHKNTLLPSSQAAHFSLRYQSTKKCRRSRCRQKCICCSTSCANPSWLRAGTSCAKVAGVMAPLPTMAPFQALDQGSLESVNPSMTLWPSRHWHWRWDAYSKSFQGWTEPTWESWNQDKPEPGADTTGDTSTGSFWARWLWKT